MGSASRFFLTLAIILLGSVIIGERLFSQMKLDQAQKQARGLPPPSSGGLTAGSEASVIPLERSGGVWVARVEFNHLYEGRLIIDTGATYTTISEDFAFDAGVKPDGQYRPLTLYTAGGNVKADVAIANHIQMGNTGRDNVTVVIHTIPNLPEDIDGLLGLSFFDQFMVHLDQARQELHITPRT